MVDNKEESEKLPVPPVVHTPPGPFDIVPNSGILVESEQICMLFPAFTIGGVVNVILIVSEPLIQFPNESVF